MNSIENIEKKIAYKFYDKSLLALAISRLTEHKAYHCQMQRMEFFGDRLLGFIAAEYVFQTYKNISEGEMSNIYIAITSGYSLYTIICGLGIIDEIKSMNAGSKLHRKHFADIYESLIAAVYIDSNMDEAKNLFHRSLKFVNITVQSNSKTILQEWCQARCIPLPVYNVINTSGSIHEPVFTVQLDIQGYSDAFEASAGSKKDAEILVANMFVQKYINK